jgi:predicted AAA+ superfamily ATPase
MTIKKYRPRIMDPIIRQRLQAFGGVLITGPKWCGKSTTGLFHAKSFINMDAPENREQYHLAPQLIMKGDYPRLIDEWQDTPSIWDRARRIIDTGQRPGLFILTGSSVPGRQPAHSGTGRFSWLKMRPMTLFESGESKGVISLKKLFEGKKLPASQSELNYERAVNYICRGGWPGSLSLDTAAALDIPKEYITSLVSSDISRTDGVARDPAKLRLLLRSLARTVTTAAKITTLKADISGGMDDTGISEKTIHSYLNALRQIFVLEEQEAWTESLRSKTRIRTMPKRHFTDPSLAVAALGASPSMLLRDTETTGFLFESLCIRDLAVYAQALNGRVCYYLDENDFEIDAIIQLDDGRWGAVEIKMGTHQFEEAQANLLRLKKRMEGILPPPSFLMILNATSGFSALQKNGIWIVALDCLAP